MPSVIPLRSQSFSNSFRNFSGIVLSKPIGNFFKIRQANILGVLHDIPSAFYLRGPSDTHSVKTQNKVKMHKNNKIFFVNACKIFTWNFTDKSIGIFFQFFLQEFIWQYLWTLLWPLLWNLPWKFCWDFLKQFPNISRPYENSFGNWYGNPYSDSFCYFLGESFRNSFKNSECSLEITSRILSTVFHKFTWKL